MVQGQAPFPIIIVIRGNINVGHGHLTTACFDKFTNDLFGVTHMQIVCLPNGNGNGAAAKKLCVKIRRHRRLPFTAWLSSRMQVVASSQLAAQGHKVSNAMKHKWEQNRLAFEVDPCQKETSYQILRTRVAVNKVK